MNTKGILRTGHLILAALLILSCNLCFSQGYTITNGHFDTDATGWSAFQGTAAWQAINSSGDTSLTPGSAVLTLTSTMGSLSQSIGITATGQTLSIYADVARDGNWTSGLIFGFYDATSWDIQPSCFVDVTTLGAADTDGTLNSFYPVVVNNVTLPNNSSAVSIFIGNSAGPYIASIVGAKFAIDNVKAITIPSGEPDWDLYN